MWDAGRIDAEHFNQLIVDVLAKSRTETVSRRRDRVRAQFSTWRVCSA